MSLTIQQVNAAIISGAFTNDQLTSIVHAVKYAREQITKRNRRTITVGSTVKFVNSRSGQTEIGTVEKMAIKFATVRTSTVRWRVPANMLEAA